MSSITKYLLLFASLQFLGACAQPTQNPPSPDTLAPAEVSKLTLTPGDGSLQMSWTDPADVDFTSVEISGTEIGSLKVLRGAATSTITGLTNGTAYTFTVKSSDSSGNMSKKGVAVSGTPAIPMITSEYFGTFRKVSPDAVNTLATTSPD